MIIGRIRRTWNTNKEIIETEHWKCPKCLWISVWTAEGLIGPPCLKCGTQTERVWA